MAVIHDIMPAFELFQPTSVDDALASAGSARRESLGDGRRPRQLRLAQGPHQAARSGHRSEPGQGTARRARRSNGGLEIGAMTTLTEVVRHPIVQREVRHSAERRRSGRLSADSQPGNHRRQRLAGCALLVLPRRLAVLSRRRQHLLRGYAHGHQSRARHPRRGPLRGRQSFGHRARVDRARREDGDSNAEGRARRRCRGLFHRPWHRHHAHDDPEARRSAHCDSHPVHLGRLAVLFRKGSRPRRCGISRWSTWRRRW